MRLSLPRIAEFIAATGHFDSSATAQGYSIDSRTVQTGELYFAVKGERLDGHDSSSRHSVEARLPQRKVRQLAGAASPMEYPCAAALLSK